MHSIDLGIGKILAGRFSKSKFPGITGRAARKLMLERFEAVMKSAIKLQPYEFSRKFQSLARHAFWKASEHRNFLLFILPVIALPLKRLTATLPLYKILIKLFVALRILSYEPFARDAVFIDWAEKLLQVFVRRYGNIFGAVSVTLKVHHLYHVADDVRKMGMPLYDYSAYPFENAIHSLKRSLHSSNQPLSQLHRRYEEAYHCHVTTAKLSRNLVKRSYKLKKKSQDELEHVIDEGTYISERFKDSFFVLHAPQSTVIRVKSLIKSNDGTIIVRAVEITDVSSQFRTGMDSKFLGVFKSHLKESDQLVDYKLEDLKNKLYLIKNYDASSYVLVSMTDILKKRHEY